MLLYGRNQHIIKQFMFQLKINLKKKERKDMFFWKWWVPKSSLHLSLYQSESLAPLFYDYPTTYTVFIFSDVLMDAFWHVRKETIEVWSALGFWPIRILISHCTLHLFVQKLLFNITPRGSVLGPHTILLT